MKSRTKHPERPAPTPLRSNSPDPESTLIRRVVLNEFEGALRGIGQGHFDVEVPQVQDASLQSLGSEIATLATRLEQKFDQIELMQRIAVDIGSGVFLEQILDRVYEACRGVIPFDRIGCALIDREHMTVRARWARTESNHPCIGLGYVQPLAGSSLEKIIQSGRPRILNDLPHYLEEHPTSESTRLIIEEGMRSSLACPLIARGTPIGFVFFSSQATGTYQPAHLDIFLQIAGQLSVVVEKSLLYEKLHELNGQLLAAQQTLQHQTLHDQLTGLPNRRAVMQALEDAVARADRSREAFGVLVMDIDHFKHINDTRGHLAGDAVLRYIGHVLADCTRTGECIGRFGGEEFLAVVQTRDRGSLLATGERIRAAISAAQVMWQDTLIPVTISVGAALAPAARPVAADELISLADAALFAAKAAGRNRMVCAEPTAGE